MLTLVRLQSNILVLHVGWASEEIRHIDCSLTFFSFQIIRSQVDHKLHLNEQSLKSGGEELKFYRQVPENARRGEERHSNFILWCLDQAF